MTSYRKLWMRGTAAALTVGLAIGIELAAPAFQTVASVQSPVAGVVQFVANELDAPAVYADNGQQSSRKRVRTNSQRTTRRD